MCWACGQFAILGEHGREQPPFSRSRTQLLHLRVNALAVRRYPFIAADHGASFLAFGVLIARKGRFARCASPSM